MAEDDHKESRQSSASAALVGSASRGDAPDCLFGEPLRPVRRWLENVRRRGPELSAQVFIRNLRNCELTDELGELLALRGEPLLAEVASSTLDAFCWVVLVAL